MTLLKSWRTVCGYHDVQFEFFSSELKTVDSACPMLVEVGREEVDNGTTETHALYFIYPDRQQFSGLNYEDPLSSS